MSNLASPHETATAALLETPGVNRREHKNVHEGFPCLKTPLADFKPEISVVTPVLNGAETIARQIDALLGQVCDREFEIVIVDDGSNDGTQAIVRRFASADPRIRFFDGLVLTRGGATAKNRGVLEAHAEKIAYCDADDRVCPGWLQTISDALETNPLVVCRRELHCLNPDYLRGLLPKYAVIEGGGSLGIR